MAENISEKEVRHIAHLARLKLTDVERDRFAAQLGGILEYIGLLNQVNTDNVEPTAHPLPLSNVFRDDAPGEPLGVDRVLENAPAKETPYFRVPKVLDQESA